MDEGSLGAILVSVLGAAAAITALTTLVVTLEALRAKLRVRTFFSEAGQRDKRLQKTLDALENADSLSPQEFASVIAELEARLSTFSDRDRAFIRQGLHQASVQGVKRFAKELATAH